MAAGIIQGTVTTTTGETVELSFLVDDTASPTKWYGARHAVKSDGTSDTSIATLVTSLAAKGTVNAPSTDYVSVQKFSSARANCGRQATTITASTSETTIVTAAASTFNDIRLLAIWNTSATATNVTIRDDTAGTTVAIIAVPAGGVGGFRLSPDDPLYQAVVNKPWTAQSSASVSSLQITVLFIKNTV